MIGSFVWGEPSVGFCAPIESSLGVQGVSLPSDPIFVIETIGREPSVGRLVSMEAQGLLVAEDLEGNQLELSTANLLKLSVQEYSEMAQTLDSGRLLLPQSDELVATIESATEESIRAQSKLIGPIEIPIDQVLGMILGLARDEETIASNISLIRDSTRRGDLLILNNSDRLDGIFQGLKGRNGTFRIENTDRTFSRQTIAAIGFDPQLLRPRNSGRPAYALVLQDGSRIKMSSLSYLNHQFRGVTSFGSEIEFELGAIVDLYAIGDHVRYLSEIEPSGQVNVPYIGPTRHARQNTNVLNGPLKIDGRKYSYGLGTQSRTLLAYRLQPGDFLFQAQVGIDDIADDDGHVVFRVLVDGNERFTTGPISGSDGLRRIEIDVSGAKILILATEFGDRGGVRDYADWIDARVVGRVPDR